MDKLDGTPPNDPNAEYELLGILLKESLSDKTIKIAYELELSTEDFYNAKHQAIWGAIAELHEASYNIAIPSIKQIIEQNPKETQYFNEAGGIDKYILECIDSCIFDPSTSDEAIKNNIGAYLKRLKEFSNRRKLVTLGQKANVEQIPFEELQAELQEIKLIIGESEDQADQIDQPSEPIKPTFPETQSSIFNEYLSIHKDKTEIPESYLFFSLMAVISMMLGHKVYIQWGDQRIYTNAYILLVGRSAMERKTSAIDKCRLLISKVASHVNMINNLASWEGLVNAMYQNPLEQHPEGIKPQYTIACIDEMDGLIKKARTEAVNNLFPNLMSLYDCPESIGVTTKTNPLKVRNPYFSILAGIQPTVITEAFNAKDAHSGFMGRFMYVYDQVTQSIPIPKQTDQSRINNLVKSLHYSIPESETKIMLSSDVEDMWTDFYNAYRFKFQDHETLCTLNQRFQNHVLKLSTIFAVLDDQTEIQKVHLTDAINIGNWLMENNRLLFRELGMSDYEKVTDRVIELLKQKSMTKRELQRQISSKLSGVLLRVIRELTELQVIREDKKKKNQVIYHFIK